eukprot:CFRG6302T1
MSQKEDISTDDVDNFSDAKTTENRSSEPEFKAETKVTNDVDDVEELSVGIEAMSAKVTRKKQIDETIAEKGAQKESDSPILESTSISITPSHTSTPPPIPASSNESRTDNITLTTTSTPSQQKVALNADVQEQQMQLPQQQTQEQQQVICDTQAQVQLMRQDTYEKAHKEQRISDADIKMFADVEKQKNVLLRKARDEPLGFMITETGRSSLLPCIFISHIFPGSVASRSGEFFVGDQIISVEGTSVVGLPFRRVLDLFKALTSLEKIEFVVIPMNMVNQVTITRPRNSKLGFDVLHGEVVCVDKNGPADIAGLKAGYRIMAINGMSVVGFTHEKIVKALSAEQVLLTTMHKDLYSTLVIPNVYTE